MSATADIARYKEYFKDLGRDERVEVLAIPNPIERNIFQRNVMYLEQVHPLWTDDLLKRMHQFARFLLIEIVFASLQNKEHNFSTKSTIVQDLFYV